MNSGSQLLSLSAAILAGGLVTFFGVNVFLRGRRGRAFVGRWRWWGLLLHYLVVAGIVVSVFARTVRAILAADGGSALDSPWFFFLFGVVLGLPLTLPTTTVVWRSMRLAKSEAGKPRRPPAAREARVAFARDLERQLREIAGEDRMIQVGLRGGPGTVLVLQGQISRQEGERLVAALRAEMRDVGLQRVEGQRGRTEGGGRRHEGADWWARV